MKRRISDKQAMKMSGVRNATAAAKFNIFSISTTIYIFLFRTLSAAGEWLSLKLLQSEAPMNGAYSFIGSIIINAMSYGLIQFIVSRVYQAVWKKKNKNIWFGGTWLHIHDKANGSIRIGTVNIKQDYYSVAVTGLNIKPDIQPASRDENGYAVMSDDARISAVDDVTCWYYKISEVCQPEESDGFSRNALYMASKIRKAATNYGMHRLTVSSYRDGIPEVLHGRFADTFPSDQGGTLYLV